ncbi:MAG: dTMP kinase [Limisphaerales bacterium]|nr:MAG: dTMP kinase [Limisphaerales bacterium]KAG0510428.1 MAG: dTMP kinase [Limisphaerales bacterium]TXT51615.1 MAG: dTMP kinase [Limisphaerales bacterium]
MSGLFITFEGTEGGGKSTQIALLAERLRTLGHRARVLREPGGTPIGEEIRHLLKHHPANEVMMPEAELLLMNASRAQLVLEVIRPALTAGEIILCDRFYDSTTAYQGYGRQLDLTLVKSVIDFAVGRTRPHLTLLLHVPPEVSEARRLARQASAGGPRDRFEEADRAFFRRVEQGFQQIAGTEPERVRIVDATQGIEAVHDDIWRLVAPHLSPLGER